MKVWDIATFPTLACKEMPQTRLEHHHVKGLLFPDNSTRTSLIECVPVHRDNGDKRTSFTDNMFTSSAIGLVVFVTIFALAAQLAISWYWHGDGSC